MRQFSVRTFITVCFTWLLLMPGGINAQVQQSHASDIRILTVDPMGEPIHEICYELIGFGPEQCASGGNGEVIFPHVPHGEYAVIASYPDDVSFQIEPFPIEVSADETVFHVEAEPLAELDSSPGASLGGSDVQLITRHPDDQSPLSGACYELLELGLAGDGADAALISDSLPVSGSACDEDGTGVVSFDGIPLGHYVVRQSVAPEGFEPIGDYRIAVGTYPDMGDGPVIVPILQADAQGHETHSNFVVAVVDETTGERVASAENCITFMEQSHCDDDIVDGQIDFMGIDPTYGQPILEVDSIGCGYESAGHNELNMNFYGEHHVTLVQGVVPTGESCG